MDRLLTPVPRAGNRGLFVGLRHLAKNRQLLALFKVCPVCLSCTTRTAVLIDTRDVWDNKTRCMWQGGANFCAADRLDAADCLDCHVCRCIGRCLAYLDVGFCPHAVQQLCQIRTQAAKWRACDTNRNRLFKACENRQLTPAFKAERQFDEN